MSQADHTHSRFDKIRISSSRIGEEIKNIALAVRTLVRMTKAVHMHQAITYHNGPLAARREEMLRIRSEVESRTRPQEHHVETNQGEPTKKRPIRRSTLPWSGEEEEDYGIMDRRWAYKALQTLGKCNPVRCLQ